MTAKVELEADKRALAVEPRVGHFAWLKELLTDAGYSNEFIGKMMRLNSDAILTALTEPELPGDVVEPWDDLGDDDARPVQLETIARTAKRWIEWDSAGRRKEGLSTDRDTHIMALPVPFWPSHGMFANWIACLELSATLIRQQAAQIASLTAREDGLRDQLRRVAHFECNEGEEAGAFHAVKLITRLALTKGSDDAEG